MPVHGRPVDAPGAVEDDCQKEGIVVSVEVSLMTPALDVVLGIADQGDL